MAYTSVNHSLSHLIRLLSFRDLNKSQTSMLKLKFVFLKTFLWWTAKRDRKDEILEPLLLQIEVVARNAVSGIQTILLSGVRERHINWDQWFPQVLDHIQLLKPEIDKAYIKISKSSPVSDTRMVVEFMSYLIDNLKDLLRSGNSSTELIQLVTKLRFLRNLLSFVATRCTDHEKLKGLSNIAETIAIEVACLPFMCSFDQKDETSTSSIKELTLKIKPIAQDFTRIYVEVLEALSPLTTEINISDPHLASFIDTLQDCLTELQDNQPTRIDSLKAEFEALHHELTFLSSFAKDPPKQFIESDKSDTRIQILLGKLRDWNSSDAHPFKDCAEHLTLKGQITCIQDLAVKVGCTVFSFFNFDEVEKHKLAEARTTLVDLIKKTKHLKSEIRAPMLTLPEVNIVRVDGLGFIRNLRELLDQLAGPFNCLRRRVQVIADELEFLSSFLKKYGERQHEHVKLRNLAAQITNVAYRAEYVNDSLLVGDGILFDPLLCFIDVTGEMKRIRREIMVFDEMPSIDMTEELVGRKHDMDTLRDELMGESRELRVIPICGDPGIGKTALAMSLYNAVDVVSHFDIRETVTVSTACDTEKKVLALLHSITGNPDTSNGEDADGTIKGKRYFILIDNLGDSAARVDLRKLFPDDRKGSRILITTRSSKIATITKMNARMRTLGSLTRDESWELLQKKIFQQQFCPPELEKAGKHIVKQCPGNPLMIARLAGILTRTRTEYWMQVGESILTDDHLFSITEEYNYLPDHLSQCFLYCGAFSLEKEILVSKLIRLWAAEGFIQQTEAKGYEDVAMDYLMELIARRFVVVCQHSSEGLVKRCKVHDRWHAFCLDKAKQENVFQLMEGYGDVSTPLGGGSNDSNISLSLTCEHRRLFIPSDWWDNISLQVSGPLVRSLVLTGRRSDFPRSHVSSLRENFKLLRVLDLGGINVGNDFPVGLEKMILLKYLEVRGEMTSVPSSIGSLRQLETFITIRLQGEVAIPDSIWSLTNLRHLHIRNCSSFGTHDYNQEVLPNLRTMSTPVLSYGKDSEEMLRRLVRLEKLKCVFLESWDSSSRKNLFPKLEILEHVHSLKLLYDGEVRKACQFSFPLNLRKLTLSGFRLPWSQASILGTLPNLEVLKLLNKTFEGREWVVGDQFLRLKMLKLDTLDLQDWYLYGEVLPNLERLEVQKCEKLQEIPTVCSYIPTLKVIEVKWCNHSLEASARRISERTRFRK